MVVAHATTQFCENCLLDILRLRPGAKVGLAVRSGRLIVEPPQRPRYTLTNGWLNVIHRPGAAG